MGMIALSKWQNSLLFHNEYTSFLLHFTKSIVCFAKVDSLHAQAKFVSARAQGYGEKRGKGGKREEGREGSREGGMEGRKEAKKEGRREGAVVAAKCNTSCESRNTEIKNLTFGRNLGKNGKKT